MRGNVTADGREPILSIEVSSPSGGYAPRVEALVDTGFDGELTLRPVTVESLGLPLVGVIESELADGSVVEEPVCDSLVVWHGRERWIRAVEAWPRSLSGTGGTWGASTSCSSKSISAETIKQPVASSREYRYASPTRRENDEHPIRDG